MGKLALWILIGLAVMLVFRLIASAKKRSEREDEAPEAVDRAGKPASGKPGRDGANDTNPGTDATQGGELMMACAVCGVHVPASDALFGRGRVYCGAEHRDVDRGKG